MTGKFRTSHRKQRIEHQEIRTLSKLAPISIRKRTMEASQKTEIYYINSRVKNTVSSAGTEASFVEKFEGTWERILDSMWTMKVKDDEQRLMKDNDRSTEGNWTWNFASFEVFWSIILSLSFCLVALTCWPFSICTRGDTYQFSYICLTKMKNLLRSIL